MTGFLFSHFLYLTIMNFNNQNLKVCNIHHADLDGAGSNIVLKNFYKTVYSIPVTYTTEWKLLEELKPYKDRIETIICTDFYPEKTINDLRKICPVLVIDHHESVQDYNNDNDIIINPTYSGTKLVYMFINKFKDIKYLNELVEIIDDYDMFRLKNPKSKYFNMMFWEMGCKWFIRRFINGNVNLYPEEKQYFKDALNEFNEMYENMEICDLARNGVFFEVSKYHTECIDALKKEGYKWFIIKNKSALSVRCDDIDLTEVCKKIGFGGGHKSAVGFPLKKTDNVGDIIKKIEYYVDELYMNSIDD